MNNSQANMETIKKPSNPKGPLDLRPEGHEAANQAAEAKRQELLAQQAATSNSLPKGMDIKPSPTVKGFSPVPGINTQPSGEANVFKLDPKELEQPPSQIQPDTQETQAAKPAEEDNALGTAEQTQEAKKPGFFAKLFGKK